MDFALTADERLLQHEVRSMLEHECGTEVIRGAEPLGFDRRLWAQFSAMGLTSVAIPEVAGGSGSFMDAAVVVDESGRALAPVPLVEHLVTRRLLAHVRSELPFRAGGEEVEPVVSLALLPAIDKMWPLVPAGAVAEYVVGQVQDQYWLDSSTPPPLSANQSSSPLADRAVAGDAQQLDIDPLWWDQALDEWRALTASLLVGLAGRALELGVAYAKEREQFGRPIGAFQTIQHLLADLAVSVDGARLLAGKAAWACEHATPRRRELSYMAFVFAAETAKRVTERVLHVHGGYGMMQEYDIQLYYRRARGWSLVAGDPERQCQELADVLFGTRSAA